MTSSLAAMLLASLSCGAVTSILNSTSYVEGHVDDGHPWSCTTLHGHSALHAVTNAVCVAALTKARLSATGCGFRNANLATVTRVPWLDAAQFKQSGESEQRIRVVLDTGHIPVRLGEPQRGERRLDRWLRSAATGIVSTRTHREQGAPAN